MPATTTPGPVARTGSRRMDALPDPLPKPPGRAPEEPIIIKDPPRQPDEPEIDDTGDEDEGPEIRPPPGIVPEKRPPPAPWERADTQAREFAIGPAGGALG